MPWSPGQGWPLSGHRDKSQWPQNWPHSGDSLEKLPPGPGDSGPPTDEAGWRGCDQDICRGWQGHGEACKDTQAEVQCSKGSLYLDFLLSLKTNDIKISHKMKTHALIPYNKDGFLSDRSHSCLDLTKGKQIKLHKQHNSKVTFRHRKGYHENLIRAVTRSQDRI